MSVTTRRCRWLGHRWDFGGHDGFWEVDWWRCRRGCSEIKARHCANRPKPGGDPTGAPTLDLTDAEWDEIHEAVSR